MAISFEMSKEQISSILRMTSPFTAEENVKITLTSSGLIKASIEEMGTVGVIELGTTSIKGVEEDISFMIGKSSLSKIASVSTQQVGFSLKEDISEVTIDIGGDKINLGLPLIEKEIDNSYEVSKKEAVLSETLNEWISRAECSNVRGASLKTSMRLGKEIIYSSTASMTVIANAFKSLDIGVSPRFARFIHNICTVGGTVELVETKNSELVLKCENVEYKMELAKENLDSLESFLEPKPVMTAKIGKEQVQTVLRRLSIPLTGDADIQITKEKDSKIKFEVVDQGGRKSKSVVEAISHEGEGTMNIKLDHLASCLSVTDSDVTFKMRSQEGEGDEPVIFQVEDSKQISYLRGNID